MSRIRNAMAGWKDLLRDQHKIKQQRTSSVVQSFTLAAKNGSGRSAISDADTKLETAFQRYELTLWT